MLATNVAETSLTVPGIRYVVDTGLARCPVQLPDQGPAAADRTGIAGVGGQRAGRCGRLADGTCIRLYSQEDHAARPPFTDPEILRTNLASVILQMAALG